MQQATINDVTLAYDIAGSGEPVVLIHGAMIAEAFRPLLSQSALTGRYQLTHYHRRGYGESSPASGPMTISDSAADCRSFLDALGVERAHVVGHSLGGVIALQLALDYPDVVHSLALLEPALVIGESGGPYRESLLQGRQRLHEVGPEVMVDEFMQARSGPDYREEIEAVLPGAVEQAVIDVRTSTESELTDMLAWHLGEEGARQIHVPVLSVVGSESDVLSPRFQECDRFLRDRIRQTESVILPDADHFMQLRNPGGLAEALADFFSRSPIRP